MGIFYGDNVELWDVELENTGDTERILSVFSYAEFSYHHIMLDNQNFQMSLYCAGSSYEQVGFLDMAHFSRVFKKQTGQSANKYRNSISA